MLAESKGVVVILGLKEAGSKVPPRRTEIAYKGWNIWVSLQNKTKPDSYPEYILVNAAGTWNESYCSYLGRSVDQLAAAKHQPKRQLYLVISKGINRSQPRS